MNYPVIVTVVDGDVSNENIAEIVASKRTIRSGKTHWGALARRVVVFESLGVFACRVNKQELQALKLAKRTKRILFEFLRNLQHDFAEPAALDFDVEALSKEQTTVQKNIEFLGIESLWHQGYFGAGVKVAVLDGGVSQQKLSGGQSFVSFRSLQDTTSTDHGTRCASVIKTPENDTRYSGVAPACELYSVKVVDPSMGTDIAKICGGLQWCLDNGIQVISCSLGLPVESPAITRAIERLVDAGIVCVAAVGNGAEEGFCSPARCEGTIGIGACTLEGTLWEKTSWLPANPPPTNVELLAPGNNIQTMDRKGKWLLSKGTSHAAPHVAGVVALLLEKHGDETVANIRLRLKRAAVPITDVPMERQGYGRLDARML